MSLLSLVPYPVRMRKAGYVLVGRKWIPKRVLDNERRREEEAKVAEKVKREAPFRVNWFSLLPQQEVPDEERFLAMTEEEWNAFKDSDIETWKTRDQRRAGLAMWDRVDMRRRARQSAAYADSGVEGSRAKLLLAIREDYYADPASYFSEEYDLYIAVEQLEDELRALPTGRWRFAAVLAQEKEEQTKWKNAQKIQAVFRGWKVRRGSVGKKVEEWESVLEGCEGL